MKNDTTLASVLLLGLFERLNWEDQDSLQTWTHHISGAIRVLQFRGRESFRTPSSLSLFRDVRQEIIRHALWSEIKVPDFVTQWCESLDSDPAQTPLDRLSVLACRLAEIKDTFRTGGKTDAALSSLAATLEADMVEWSRTASAGRSTGKRCDPVWIRLILDLQAALSSPSAQYQEPRHRAVHSIGTAQSVHSGAGTNGEACASSSVVSRKPSFGDPGHYCINHSLPPSNFGIPGSRWRWTCASRPIPCSLPRIWHRHRMAR